MVVCDKSPSNSCCECKYDLCKFCYLGYDHTQEEADRPRNELDEIHDNLISELNEHEIDNYILRMKKLGGKVIVFIIIIIVFIHMFSNHDIPEANLTFDDLNR